MLGAFVAAVSGAEWKVISEMCCNVSCRITSGATATEYYNNSMIIPAIIRVIEFPFSYYQSSVPEGSVNLIYFFMLNPGIGPLKQGLYTTALPAELLDNIHHLDSCVRHVCMAKE